MQPIALSKHCCSVHTVTSATAGKPNNMQDENEWMGWRGVEQSEKNSFGNSLSLPLQRTTVGSRRKVDVQRWHRENKKI